MNQRASLLAVLCLLALLGGASLAEDFPGGQIQTRPSLESERGSHPTIVVQTIPDATTTATCLAIRHAEPSRVSQPAGTAHLLEHLMFRTQPGGRPGGLLLKSELLGNQRQAWVDSEFLVLQREGQEFFRSRVA